MSKIHNKQISNKSKIKHELNSSNFDPSIFLESYLKIENDDDDDDDDDDDEIKVSKMLSETQLLQVFEGLTNELTSYSNDLEDGTVKLQNDAVAAKVKLHKELDLHSIKLEEVKSSVSQVHDNFVLASSSAVAIGKRLATSERERKRVDSAKNWMLYIQELNEVPTEKYMDLFNFRSERKKSLLPENLRDKDWGEISRILYELRRILIDINCNDVNLAQKNLILITESIEMELLEEFESTILKVMDNQNNDKLCKKAKELACWLQFYNNGISLQKRFVYSVVQKRIPKIGAHSNTLLNTIEKSIDKALLTSKVANNMDGFDDDDSDDSSTDDSSAGGSFDNGENNKFNNSKINQKSIVSEDIEPLSVDHLSQLFGVISATCEEQFVLIRKIFPPYTVARITRVLVLRIFNDPAFGIQTKVDTVLHDKSLADYLDALAIVREKLSALYIVLLDYCTHPALRGMGTDGAFRNNIIISPFDQTTIDNDTSEDKLTQSILSFDRKENIKDNIINETDQLKSDSEVSIFLEEQVTQVLSSYIVDYFYKEMTYVRIQLTQSLQEAIDDSTALTRPIDDDEFPHIKPEKIKNIYLLNKTICNVRYINRLFSIMSESLYRMENIGRDDKKLPIIIKDLFVLFLEFLVDNLFISMTNHCNNVLLKIVNGRSQSHISLPEMEYLQVLGVIHSGVHKLQILFDGTFIRNLSQQPNLILICKEARRKSLKILDIKSKELLFLWIHSVSLHFEYIFTQTQGKMDFSPKVEKAAKYIESTSTCTSIVKTLLAVISNIQTHQSSFVDLDIKEFFWKPFGQRFVGILISHIKKQKISQHGALILIKDIEEYCDIISIIETTSIIDMMDNLKELMTIFTCSSDQVLALIDEKLRHIDNNIILALMRARDDNVTNNFSFNNILSAINHKESLLWENKSIIRLSNVGNNSNSLDEICLGPETLKKASVSLSSFFMSEMASDNYSNDIDNNNSINGHNNHIISDNLKNNIKNTFPDFNRLSMNFGSSKSSSSIISKKDSIEHAIEGARDSLVNIGNSLKSFTQSKDNVEHNIIISERDHISLEKDSSFTMFRDKDSSKNNVSKQIIGKMSGFMSRFGK